MSDRRLAFSLLGAAFLARVSAWLGSALFSVDGASYLLMADWMREGKFHEALLIAYHPLYPLLTAVGRSFVGRTETAGCWVSILLGSLAILPLFSSIRSVFGRPTAFVASLMYAFHPKIVELQSDTMTEGAFFFFFLTAMWLTSRMMKEPSLERGAALGIASAGAFLVRPEGALSIVLALAWPAVELFRRREEVLKRSAGLATTALVIVLLLSPYVLWVRSVRGHWALSVRPSTVSLEQAVGVTPGSAGDDGGTRLYALFGQSILRITHYGALLPLFALGILGLRRIGIGEALFYFSYPLGLMGGILLTLRTHNAMSQRYLLLSMTLLFALAGQGTVGGIRYLARSRPRLPALIPLSGGLILLVAVIPGARWLALRRSECRSYPAAAQWILSQGLHPRVMSGTTPEIGYLTGSRALNILPEAQAIRDQIQKAGVEYFAYEEREARQKYGLLLQSCDLLEPPVQIAGPPGSDKVFVQLVKRP
jgi:4-amino-4-deoxy-L-arabinose transferase-like glycosyltransferase